MLGDIHSYLKAGIEYLITLLLTIIGAIFTYFKNKINTMEKNTSQIKTEYYSFKNDVMTELVDMKAEIKHLKEDVEELKEEVKVLNKEIVSIKSDLKEILVKLEYISKNSK